MQTATAAYNAAMNMLKRSVKAQVSLRTGDTTSLFQGDRIVSIEIQRAGEESKFFGFGVFQKATIKLVDRNRELDIPKGSRVKLQLGMVLLDGTIEYKDFPSMYVSEVQRDEKTNELTITAFDILNDATAHTASEIEVSTPYTLKTYLMACGELLGVSAIIFPDLDSFNLEYAEGANLEGSETLRDILTAAAEVTQTIYYVNKNDELVFKRLSNDRAIDKVISKAAYINFKSGVNQTLQAIASTTELGDNIIADTELEGVTQYVRNNPFWELRDDIAALVDAALEEMQDTSIYQFECEWRGDPATEPGDKIACITKDDEVIHSYLLSDTLTFTGGLKQKTEWKYTTSEHQSSNPTNLGERLKQTYAKVDKQSKQIEILTSETDANAEEIAVLKLNTESISASVSKMEQTTTDAIGVINSDINTLTKKVEATISAEDVQLQIQSELANGVNKVTTTTGFTFDETGLTVSKTGSEMTTNIDEDGMSVFRDNTEVLTADNTGVTAYNLTAKTYLIVGENSRFEDFESIDGEARTGCFWIGG